MRAHAFVLLTAALVLVACASDPTSSPGADVDAQTGADVAADTSTDVPTDDIWQPPAPTLWPENDLPPVEGPFFEAHPELLPLSRWRTHIDHVTGPVPDVRGRGSFGLGNGRVFALMGMTHPANTIHGMAGPNYDQSEQFFGDLAVGLEGDGRDWSDVDEEWVTSAFGAPALVYHARRGELTLSIVDLVPWPAGGTGAISAERRTWYRTILVRNTGSAPATGLHVVLHSVRGGPTEGGDALTETRLDRRLVSFFAVEGGTTEGRFLRLPLADLAPGEERRVTLAHLTLLDGGDVAADRAAAAAADVDALLTEAATAFQAWWEGLAVLETPDPMVDDLARALVLAIRMQTTSSGAPTEMSRYALTWTRDNAGAILGWLAVGAHEEAAALLDYYYRAVLEVGGIANAYDAAIDITTPAPDPPDWEALGQGTGRTAGEAPSYIPLMYRWFADWTGGLTRATERAGFLRYALDIQQVSEDGLLTWSGDETFRAAMNAAMGISIEYPLQEETFSTNSVLLHVAAARALAGLADAWDDTALATDLRQRADTVEQAGLDLMRSEDGCWAAYRFRDTGELSPAPYEDVALKEIWAGARDGDDPDAAARLHCLVDRLGQAPGILQSPLHEQYIGSPIFGAISEGVYTGMLPGYTLVAMTRAGHPEAEAAFNAVRLSSDTAGQTSEMMVYDDHLPLQILYMPDGSGMVDFAARYRSWEGGIVLHAMLDYLFGLRPEALEGDRFGLRPHLPNDWPSARLTHAQVAGARFDLEMRRVSPDAVEVRVTSHADRPFTVAVRWDHDPAAPPSVAVDGAPVAEGDLVRHAHTLGTASTEVRDLTLAAGAELVVRVGP